MTEVNPFPNRPLVIGHRGAAGEAPENTLASFGLAVKQGADAVELDVHLSADGELIVCHDATVNRTTDGAGVIAEMTTDQLRRLDAGRWYDETYAGEGLPTLEEVFVQVPAWVMINVEIKCPYSPRLQQRLLELLKQYGRLDSTVVSSFNHKILRLLQEAEPALKIGLLYDANLVHHRGLAEGSGMKVYSLHPHHLLIDPEDVADAAAHGLKVYPFTVNDEVQMHRAIRAGMSGIITDYPARLRLLLERLS
ncbi:MULTISPECIES: glycerophosphodiester phosphodiesterase [Paenibacillus]|uniref:glycerophosphodiester phosphodiesterase n=1 Tax=Paenibacillus TaxID=44249 RepID=UPI0022B93673|nr:glycerophosphodiester phosphodiesterase family protein [Paenibacillus caseinilyticus]MCZ8523126.1 glycerophosphodiester phosphodiesterase family protein [Paenibacillus caseinilyticus]